MGARSATNSGAYLRVVMVAWSAIPPTRVTNHSRRLLPMRVLVETVPCRESDPLVRERIRIQFRCHSYLRILQLQLTFHLENDWQFG